MSKVTVANVLLTTLFTLAIGSSARLSAQTQTVRAYESKIDTDKDEILVLDNGAVVEVVSGYLGYLGYRKRVLLLVTGSSCRIAISGKRTFRCSVLKPPTTGRARAAEAVSLSGVRGNGAILLLTDGRILEVDGVGQIYSALWLPPAELVILDGSFVVNLDDPSETVMIVRIR